MKSHKFVFLIFSWCVLVYISLPVRAQRLQYDLQPYSIELEDSANCGITEAEYKFGKYLYQSGKYANKDKIVNLFKKAAIKGNADAMYGLARITYDYISSYDADSVLYWFRKAADLGNRDALYAMYQVYAEENYSYLHTFLKLKKNKKLAESYFQQALSSRSDEALWKMGRILTNKNDYSGAVKYYELSANEGNTNSMYWLGEAYYNGNGVAQDKQKALQLWQQAAQLGAVSCNLYIGDYYFSIEDSIKGIDYLAKYTLEFTDWSSVREKLESIAQRGNPIAQYWMGEYYLKKGGAKPFLYKDDAEKWFCMSAKQNYAPAKGKLGYCYVVFHDGWEDTGFRWTISGAEQNDAYSQWFAGICYDAGYGVDKNEKEAAKWYLKAAENGYANAQTIIGDFYRTGNNFSKNIQKATNWYEKAAEQDEAKAYQGLGIIYALNNEDEKSLNYFLKAANKFAPYSLFRVGLYYYEIMNDDNASSANRKELGNVGKAREKALRLFYMADSLGNDNAPYYIGQYYEKGLFGEYDIDKAIDYYTKAEEKGHRYSTYYLGKIYYEGKLIAADYNKAFNYLKSASEGDDPSGSAMRLLSACYRYGKGTAVDLNRADFWMQQAAKHKDKIAEELITKEY